MAFCLANALTYFIIFNSQFCFYSKGILEGFFGFYERRTCNSRISKGLYDAVINRLGQQQAYESSRRNLMHFLIQQTRMVVGERVGSLQAFLRICTRHMQYTQLSMGIFWFSLYIWYFSCTVTYYSSCFVMKEVPSCSNNLKSPKVAAFFIFSISK